MPAYREYRCGKCHLRGVICAPGDHYVPVSFTFEWQCPSCGTGMLVRGEAWEIGECPEGAVLATRLPPGP